MIGYKLFRRRKNGTLGPLFINRKQVIPIGQWLQAEDHQTKGYQHRPGWHATLQMRAPHLKKKSDRVWCMVDVGDFSYFNRPDSQGGQWLLAKWMKVINIIE